MAAVVCRADPLRQSHLRFAAELLVREYQFWGWCVSCCNTEHPFSRAGHTQATEATLHHGDLVSSRCQHWPYDFTPNGVSATGSEVAGILNHEGERL